MTRAFACGLPPSTFLDLLEDGQDFNREICAIGRLVSGAARSSSIHRACWMVASALLLLEVFQVSATTTRRCRPPLSRNYLVDLALRRGVDTGSEEPFRLVAFFARPCQRAGAGYAPNDSSFLYRETGT